MLLVFCLFLGLIGFLANAGIYITGATQMFGATSLATGLAKLSVDVCLFLLIVGIRD